MRTSAEDVYAAGDVALAHNAAAGRHLAVEHWGEALNMGEVAGRTIAGETTRSGTSPPASGRRSASTRSSTSPGATASTRRAWSTTAAAPGPSGTARDGTTVGVLTHERDEDYEAGRERVETGAPLP